MAPPFLSRRRDSALAILPSGGEEADRRRRGEDVATTLVQRLQMAHRTDELREIVAGRTRGAQLIGGHQAVRRHALRKRPGMNSSRARPETGISGETPPVRRREGVVHAAFTNQSFEIWLLLGFGKAEPSDEGQIVERFARLQRRLAPCGRDQKAASRSSAAKSSRARRPRLQSSESRRKRGRLCGAKGRRRRWRDPRRSRASLRRPDPPENRRAGDQRPTTVVFVARAGVKAKSPLWTSGDRREIPTANPSEIGLRSERHRTEI